MRTNTTTCARLLAYVTGLVNQELLLQNEYLAAENRILQARLKPGLRLSDGERATLAEIGKGHHFSGEYSNLAERLLAFARTGRPVT